MDNNEMKRSQLFQMIEASDMTIEQASAYMGYSQRYMRSYAPNITIRDCWLHSMELYSLSPVHDQAPAPVPQKEVHSIVVMGDPNSIAALALVAENLINVKGAIVKPQK